MKDIVINNRGMGTSVTHAPAMGLPNLWVGPTKLLFNCMITQKMSGFKV